MNHGHVAKLVKAEVCKTSIVGSTPTVASIELIELTEPDQVSTTKVS